MKPVDTQGPSMASADGPRRLKKGCTCFWRGRVFREPPIFLSKRCCVPGRKRGSCFTRGYFLYGQALCHGSQLLEGRSSYGLGPAGGGRGYHRATGVHPWWWWGISDWALAREGVGSVRRGSYRRGTHFDQPYRGPPTCISSLAETPLHLQSLLTYSLGGPQGSHHTPLVPDSSSCSIALYLPTVHISGGERSQLPSWAAPTLPCDHSPSQA